MDNDPPPPVNRPPTITGAPANTITRGETYLFTPTASDPDGDELSFSILNRPAWAAFDESTGRLTGTPDEQHIGVSEDVAISVSDGTDTASLDPFDLEVLEIWLGNVTVSWDIPTQNADGSPMDDLAGYEVHFGTAPGEYTQIVEVSGDTVNSVVIDELSADTYFFAVLAVDDADNRSELSVEVQKDLAP